MNVQTLLIDDDRILHFLMEKILAKVEWNYPFSTFENGQSAIEYFKSNYSKDTQFIVFLDINMPVMNGWEFLAALDQIVDHHDNVSVFVLSSSINSNDKERAEAHRLVHEFISKPIYHEKLESIKDYFKQKLGSI